MRSNQDFVFPDDHEWMREVLLGKWSERKSPSSAAMRKFLAEFVRLMRAEMAARLERLQNEYELTSEHLLELCQGYRRAVRDVYREARPRAIEFEADLAEFRTKLLLGARPTGGVQ
jgi:hypothetical protein